MKNKTGLLLALGIILVSSFVLSACNKKTPAQKETVPVAEKTFEIKENDRPYISLIPRNDGHQLKIKLANMPSYVSKVEYELLYTAKDEDSGMEIEKGVSGTMDMAKSEKERDLLLGTESCTNGCKYKYDEGITGGTLSLNFFDKNGQQVQFETPFALTSSSDLKKNGALSLETENFKVKVFPGNKNEFFIAIKNYGLPVGTKAKTIYSVFTSDNGKGKVTIETTDNFSKADSSVISGDYLIN